MKIKNLNIVRDKVEDIICDPIRLVVLGIGTLVVVAGVSSIPAIIKGQKYINSAKPIEKTLAAGEHIISVPLERTMTKKQYEYHEGYKVVGMNEKHILYANYEEVTVTGKIYEDGKCEFLEFGTPVKFVETTNEYYIK